MQNPHKSLRQPCPECHKLLEPQTAYAPWCTHCNWNVCPSIDHNVTSQQAPLSRIEPIFKQLDQSLLEAMISQYRTSRTLRLTALRLSAIAVSFVSYLCSAIIFYVVYKVVENGSSFLAMTAAIVLGVVTAVALWPRFGKEPPNAVAADAAEFPVLNQVVATVAKELNVAVPKVFLTEQFDATFGRVGVRRTPLLMLGHPFLSLLEPEEIVTLIAHELAHDRDGTITRSVFVQIAYSAVNRWTAMLDPFQFVWRGIPILPVMIPCAMLWLPVQIFAQIFAFIKQREGHHAEYEADRLSIAVSGNGSAESLMRKSLYGHIVPLRQAYASAAPAAKFQAVLQSLATVPEREIERLWRIAHIVAEREVAQTHPSLHNRLQFVNSFKGIKPSVRLSDEQFAKLRLELIKWPSVLSERQAYAMQEREMVELGANLNMVSGD